MFTPDARLVCWLNACHANQGEVLKRVCIKYRGAQHEEIHAAVEVGAYLKAYYLLTQVDQDTANVTKQALFAKHNFFADISGRKEHDQNCGERSARTYHWEKLMRTMIPWWDMNLSAADVDARLATMDNITQTVAAAGGGTIDGTWRYSHVPTTVGTGLHEEHGEEMMNRARSTLGYPSNVEYEVPGRTPHLGIPLLGNTTDCRLVTNKTAYTDLLCATAANHDSERRRLHVHAAPYWTSEIKTLHRADACILPAEINDLCRVLETGSTDKLRDATFALLTRKLVAGNYLPERALKPGSVDRDWSTATRTSPKGKVTMFRHQPITTLTSIGDMKCADTPYTLQRTTKLMHAADWYATLYHVHDATGDIFPNLAAPRWKRVACVGKPNPKWRPHTYSVTEDDKHVIDVVNPLLRSLQVHECTLELIDDAGATHDYEYVNEGEQTAWLCIEERTGCRFLYDAANRGAQNAYEPWIPVRVADGDTSTRRYNAKQHANVHARYRQPITRCVGERARLQQPCAYQAKYVETLELEPERRQPSRFSPRDMVAPGRACCHVYSVGSADHRYLFTVEWDEAPLLLPLQSDFFTQMLSQASTDKQLNDKARSSFTLALRTYRSPDTPFKQDPIQLAMVYTYEPGITDECVSRFTARLLEECGYAEQGIREPLERCGLWPPTEMVDHALDTRMPARSQLAANWMRVAFRAKLDGLSSSEPSSEAKKNDVYGFMASTVEGVVEVDMDEFDFGDTEEEKRK